MIENTSSAVHLIKSVGIFRLDWIGKMPFPKVCGGISIAREHGYPGWESAPHLKSRDLFVSIPVVAGYRPVTMDVRDGMQIGLALYAAAEHATSSGETIHIRRMQKSRSDTTAHRVGELLIGCQD